MKIRIKENSIRLRLTRSEVAQFLRDGYYSQTCTIGSSLFSYTLKSSAEADNLCAHFKNGEITVLMPSTWLLQWADEAKVGFSGSISVEDGKVLLIKVEKDFVCLDDTDEDQSDNYPNPKG